jgi:hypothetical protein
MDRSKRSVSDPTWPSGKSTEEQARWSKENRQALESINAFIDRHGLLANRLRVRPDQK